MKLLFNSMLLYFSMGISSSSFAYEVVPQSRPGDYGSSKNLNCPIVIRPGKGIGALELGRSIKEIESLGMDIKSVGGSKRDLIVGRFSVGFTEQGKVSSIDLELGDAPDCLTYQGKKIRKSMSSSQLAKIFKSCQPESMRTGGNLTECEGISIGTGGWGGSQKTPQLKVVADSAAGI